MLSQEDKSPTAAGLLQEVETLLAKGRRRDAYQLAAKSVARHASDPFILSYFGYLEASVNGRYRSGIEACTRAITLFKKKMLRGNDDTDESQMAILYLNLGRAYIAAEKKKEAIESLNAGLKFDRRNRDLVAELERMGIRRFTPVPFLRRTNPINEVIGRIMRKKDEENRQHA